MAEVTITGTPGQREYTITLPPGLPMLSLNGREHWAKRADVTRDIKAATWALAHGKATPFQRAEITVEYQPPDRRHRDADNLAPTGKACIDGLVAAGVLPDDDSSHVTAVRYQIGDTFPGGRVILHVREMERRCAST